MCVCATALPVVCGERWPSGRRRVGNIAQRNPWTANPPHTSFFIQHMMAVEGESPVAAGRVVAAVRRCLAGTQGRIAPGARRFLETGGVAWDGIPVWLAGIVKLSVGPAFELTVMLPHQLVLPPVQREPARHHDKATRPAEVVTRRIHAVMAGHHHRDKAVDIGRACGLRVYDGLEKQSVDRDRVIPVYSRMNRHVINKHRSGAFTDTTTAA